MDQLPRLGKRELICLLSFACNYVVFVWRGFLFLWVLGMGYVILLWHSLSLPYNYFRGDGKRPVQAYLSCKCPVVVRIKLDLNTMKYIITKVITVNNHTISAGEFKHFSTNRRLADEERILSLTWKSKQKTLRVIIYKHQKTSEMTCLRFSSKLVYFFLLSYE